MSLHAIGHTLNHVGHIGHGIHGLTELAHEDGVEGAARGALSLATTAVATLGWFGLALTPLGWAVALGAGAAIGGSGIIKKMSGDH